MVPARPAPTVAVIVRQTPPSETTLTDYLQGWGTVFAAMAALYIAWWSWRRENRLRKEDSKEAEKLRKEDQHFADHRLREERDAADRRLQQQLDEQRDRDRCRFLVDQLQKAALYWSQGQIARLPGVLVAIPDQYATILRLLVLGEDYQDLAGFPPLSETTYNVLQRLLEPRGVTYHGQVTYLIQQRRELEEENERQGRSKGWSRLDREAQARYKTGFDHKLIRHAWLYEEIGENIAELLGQMKSEGDASPEETPPPVDAEG